MTTTEMPLSMSSEIGLLPLYSCMLSCDRYDMPLQTVIAYGLALFVAMEAALILYQRDCLVLILIQLFVNPQWLIDFQQCESFADWWLLLE